MLKKSICVFSLFLLTACSPSSTEDFREAGKAINKSLIKELKEVHTQDELVAKLPSIEKLFARLTDLMIAARKLQVKQQSSSTSPLTKEEQLVSDILRAELNRIYLLPSGKELIEKAQRQSLDKMDHFEQQLKSS